MSGPAGRNESRVKLEWYGELVRRSKIHLDTQINQIDQALRDRTEDVVHLRTLLRQLRDESAELRRQLDKPMG